MLHWVVVGNTTFATSAPVNERDKSKLMLCSFHNINIKLKCNLQIYFR